MKNARRAVLKRRAFFFVLRVSERLSSHSGNPIEWLQRLVKRRLVAIFHQVRVFDGILIEVSQNRDCPKPKRAEEYLSYQIAFPYFQQNTVSALVGELSNKLIHHLQSDATLTMVWVHGEIQYVQSCAVKLVYHEPHNAVSMFGHHSDAVPLPQTTYEVLF